MPWRVLLADDDLEICSLIGTILRKTDCDLTVCHDAESALLRIANDEEFDLLVSDFMLPGMTGIDLIRHLRTQPATSTLPIVLISGHEADAVDRLAVDAGANAFFTKPFALNDFRATVRRLLRGDATLLT